MWHRSKNDEDRTSDRMDIQINIFSFFRENILWILIRGFYEPEASNE